jgi:hypothetical protein
VILVKQETNENVVQNLRISVTQAASAYDTSNDYSNTDADTETEVHTDGTGVHCMRPRSHVCEMMEKRKNFGRNAGGCKL